MNHNIFRCLALILCVVFLRTTSGMDSVQSGSGSLAAHIISLSAEEDDEQDNADLAENEDKSNAKSNIVEVDLDQIRLEQGKDISPDERAAVRNRQISSPIVLSSDTYYKEVSKVRLQLLNKQSAQKQYMIAEVNHPISFERLNVTVKRAFVTPPEESLSVIAYLEVKEVNIEDDTVDSPVVFSGWMYSTSPSLKTVEHPVYDVKLENCRVVSDDKYQNKKKEDLEQSKEDVEA